MSSATELEIVPVSPSSKTVTVALLFLRVGVRERCYGVFGWLMEGCLSTWIHFSRNKPTIERHKGITEKFQRFQKNNDLVTNPFQFNLRLANMHEVLQTTLDLFTALKPVVPIAASVTGMNFLGARLGPGRALSLAFHSKFFYRPEVPSVRSQVVERIKTDLSTMAAQQYLVVTGPKGGEDYCTTNCASAKEILQGALREVAGRHFTSLTVFSPHNSARRVLWYYKGFAFLRGRLPTTQDYPILVLQVKERPENKPFAPVLSATRTLTSMGLRVVIDASPHSVESAVLRSKRQYVVNLGLMNREEVMSDPTFQQLFNKLQTKGLDTLVWNVIGGNPAQLTMLNAMIQSSDDNVEAAVERVVMEAIHFASNDCTIARGNHIVDSLLDQYSSQKQPVECPKGLDASQVKVLELQKDETLVPATPAIDVVLRYKSQVPGHPKVLTFEFLRSVFAS
ncbi:hypothetical protein QOT17_004895 [Balamuthia mandrillaris]